MQFVCKISFLRYKFIQYVSILYIFLPFSYNTNFYRFTDLPEAIYDVVSLESLIANDNVIATIDVSSLEKLKKLAILNLTNNNIAHVPPELGNLKNLR